MKYAPLIDQSHIKVLSPGLYMMENIKANNNPFIDDITIHNPSIAHLIIVLQEDCKYISL